MGIAEQLHEMDAAVGSVAVMSLDARGLLPTGLSPTGRHGPAVGGAASHDRARGVLLGIAIGAAAGAAANLAGRSGREPSRPIRTGATPHAIAVGLSLVAWRQAGWRAPLRLSDEFLAHEHALIPLGRAIPASIARRRGGEPWFEAGVASFGDAALPRAAAIGALFADEPARRALAAAVDCALTHAASQACAAAVALADLVAALACATAEGAADESVRKVLPTIADDDVRNGMEAALRRAGAPVADARRELFAESTASETLAFAVWCLLSGTDPLGVLDLASAGVPRADTVSAVAGALAGARYGASALESAVTAPWRGNEGLRDEAEAAFPGPGAAPITDVADGEPGSADIWMLLDRSGSMGPLVGDVEGGVDSFVAQQRGQSGRAQLTLIQFDGGDPCEVLFDRLPLDQVPSLAGRFQPRGMTPLFDAIGLMLDRAERSPAADPDRLVVVFTDGHENASRRYSSDGVFARIERLKRRGWTFVFLGANQDSYHTSARLGMSAGNTSNYAADGQGTRAAYASLHRATSSWRGKPQHQRLADREDFWEGRKEAEEDLGER